MELHHLIIGTSLTDWWPVSTTRIEPTNSEITFKSLRGSRKGSARAAQYIPSLFPPNQEQCSDSIPIEIIDDVSKFYSEFNATSPNVKDTEKRRVCHKQWETT